MHWLPCGYRECVALGRVCPTSNCLDHHIPKVTGQGIAVLPRSQTPIIALLFGFSLLQLLAFSVVVVSFRILVLATLVRGAGATAKVTPLVTRMRPATVLRPGMASTSSPRHRCCDQACNNDRSKRPTYSHMQRSLSLK